MEEPGDYILVDKDLLNTVRCRTPSHWKYSTLTFRRHGKCYIIEADSRTVNTWQDGVGNIIIIGWLTSAKCALKCRERILRATWVTSSLLAKCPRASTMTLKEVKLERAIKITPWARSYMVLKKKTATTTLYVGTDTAKATTQSIAFITNTITLLSSIAATKRWSNWKKSKSNRNSEYRKRIWKHVKL